MGDESLSDGLLSAVLTKVGASEYLQRFRFGGVVGKLAMVGVICILVIGGVALKLSNQWFLISAIAVVAGVAVFIVIKVINFADRHPELALLEGADLLRWQQMQLEAKGMGPQTGLVRVQNVSSGVTTIDGEGGGSK